MIIINIIITTIIIITAGLQIKIFGCRRMRAAICIIKNIEIPLLRQIFTARFN